MKKKGSKSDFTQQRNSELYKNFKTVLRESRDVALRDMFGMAAAMPASRFWVSERTAADTVWRFIHAESNETPPEQRQNLQARIARMLPEKYAMYAEITRRVRERIAADPELCVTQAVDIVVNEPAPQFYITPESARSIIYRHRRRRQALSQFIIHNS